MGEGYKYTWKCTECNPHMELELLVGVETNIMTVTVGTKNYCVSCKEYVAMVLNDMLSRGSWDVSDPRIRKFKRGW